MWTTKASSMGCGEEKRGVAAQDADLSMLIWEEVRRVHQGVLLEVEHVKAHCSKKEKQDMTFFERFEKTDELAKDGANWMEEKWRRSASARFSRKEKRFTREMHRPKVVGKGFQPQDKKMGKHVSGRT